MPNQRESATLHWIAQTVMHRMLSDLSGQRFGVLDAQDPSHKHAAIDCEDNPSDERVTNLAREFSAFVGRGEPNAFVRLPLPKPWEAEGFVMTHKPSGISVRVIRQFDLHRDRFVIRVDSAFRY